MILADDVWSIPLFSRPTYLLNANKVKGVAQEPDAAGLDLERRDVECHLVANASPFDVQ